MPVWLILIPVCSRLTEVVVGATLQSQTLSDQYFSTPTQSLFPPGYPRSSISFVRPPFDAIDQLFFCSHPSFAIVVHSLCLAELFWRDLCIS